ncbi:MAG: hypothetical protein EBT05_10940 [Betaproteobacteria bacterium]|nr:hypothetical protein [Betaproteobacteria bacterium]
MHKTPSAVSLHLSKLAQTLARELLQRQGRRLVLTHDGTELVRYARRILALQGEAVAHFQATDIGGALRVGLPDDYIPVLMTPLLATLARLAPRAHIEVLCAPSAELRPMLADGQLDLAILSAETDTQEGAVLRTEQVVWTASAQHDVHLAACLPVAFFPEGCIFRKWALAQLRKHRRDHTGLFVPAAACPPFRRRCALVLRCRWWPKVVCQPMPWCSRRRRALPRCRR